MVFSQNHVFFFIIIVILSSSTVFADGDSSLDFTSQITETLKNAWDFFVKLVTEGVEGVAKWINDNIVKPVLDAIAGVWTGILDGFAEANKVFWNTINAGIEAIGNAFKQYWDLAHSIIYRAFGPFTPLVYALSIALAAAIIYLILKILPGSPL